MPDQHSVESIAFGDLSKYFVRIVNGVRFESSDEFRFQDDLVAFRWLGGWPASSARRRSTIANVTRTTEAAAPTAAPPARVAAPPNSRCPCASASPPRCGATPAGTCRSREAQFRPSSFPSAMPNRQRHRWHRL